MVSLPIGDPIPPGDFQELKRLLRGLFVVACCYRVVYVVIDSVDCLRVGIGADDLSWLPDASNTPANLRVIVSSRSETSGHGVISPAAALQRMGYSVKPLPRLKDADSRLILTSVLGRYGIELQPTTLSAILTKRCVRCSSKCTHSWKQRS